MALIHGLDASGTFLANVNHNNDSFQLTSTSLKQVPDESHIITHPKKQNSAILTNIIISMEDEHDHAMLATLEGPIRTHCAPSYAYA
jgi:hypothetical protein